MRIPQLFLLVFVFFVSLSLFAETEMRVYGYIFTADREPAEYVAIQVVGTGVGTISRREGYYELVFSIEDSATVKFAFLGFETYYYKVSTKQPRIQKMI